MYDVITIGDATLDVFMQIEDATVVCELDNENCRICLPYAEKIAARTADFIIGGNAANAAVGSRRLGVTSAFFGTIGNDETGKQIQQVFHQEGVSTEYLTVEEAPSNYSVVINFQGERTILVHHIPRKYQWTIQQPPKWFYVTSMGEGFEPIYDKVAAMVREAHAMMSFNPGTHQLKKGLEALKPMIAATSILFLNKEESAHLLSLPENTPVQELMEGLRKLGPEIVVITDGKKGAYASDGKEFYQLGIYDGPVVERTGAGDAFATAFTVARMEGRTISEAMQWGNANSTSVVAYVGPEKGLLTQAGIQDTIAKNPNVKPVLLLSQANVSSPVTQNADTNVRRL